MTDADVLAVLKAQQAEHTPTMPATTPPTAGEWMGTEPATVLPGIRDQIIDMIANQPRSLQTEIGPSEMGTTCLHCLTRRLQGRATQPVRAAEWLPFIGTAVHAQFERMYKDRDGYEAELKVPVTNLNAERPITGSIDLWEWEHRASIDWKIVGNSTLDDVRRHGPSQQYKIQASLYGIGMDNMQERRGDSRRTQRSCIYYLPRNATSIDAGIMYETTFDPMPGRWAISRARLIISLISLIACEYGADVADQWADALPRDPAHCFHCRDLMKQAGNRLGDVEAFGAEQTHAAPEPDPAANLPDLPRALLKVPQAEYRPQPNNQPTTTSQQ